MTKLSCVVCLCSYFRLILRILRTIERLLRGYTSIKTIFEYPILILIKPQICIGAVVVVWKLDLQLPVQSVPITTNVVSLNPIHGEVYSIQHYVISVTCDKSVVFCGYSGFLHQFDFNYDYFTELVDLSLVNGYVGDVTTPPQVIKYNQCYSSQSYCSIHIKLNHNKVPDE
jgi:hypothetical protein